MTQTNLTNTAVNVADLFCGKVGEVVMKDVDFVNQCAWKIESLKHEKIKIIRECNDKVDEIDKRIWSLQEQIKNTNVTSNAD